MVELRNGLFLMFALSTVSLIAATMIALRRLSRRPLLGAGTPASPQVRAAQRRAHETLHSIGDAVISTDADDRVEYMNVAAERLTGWSLDEARGHPISLVCRNVNEPGFDRAPVAEETGRRSAPLRHARAPRRAPPCRCTSTARRWWTIVAPPPAPCACCAT